MAHLPDPHIQWRDDGTPVSGRFGDVYFSADGVAESRHVFVDGIGGPDVWRGRRRFAVAETGFGTGLNFLCLWKAWRDTAPAGARLDYVSVEGHPLAPADMARAHGGFIGFADLAGALRRGLPAPVGGYHQCLLDGGRVRLLMLHGDALAMLRGLVAEVDAWFLDGFAPAKNPSMWTPDLFTQVARLTKPGGAVATFTAAGAVRRGLAAAGFAMEKRPGHGTKRECLAGRLREPKRPPDPAPWFRPPPAVDGPIAIIGAGIAGCALARALAETGVDAVLHEAGDGPAAGASGTPAAIVQPRPHAGDDANGLFHAAAYRRAVALYDALERGGHRIWLHRGLLVMGRDDDDAARYRRLIEDGPLTDDEARWLDTGAASARAGLALGRGGAWFGAAGTVDTRALCGALASGLAVKPGRAVRRLARQDGGWRLIGEGGAVVGEAASVVVAAGPASLGLADGGELDLFANRGQLTLLVPNEAIAGQLAPITYGGYLSPAVALDGASPRHVLGSTFERLGKADGDADVQGWQAPRTEDDNTNLGTLANRLPELARPLPDDRAAWVGVRATTTDRMPLLGAMPDGPRYGAAYGALRHGPAGREFADAPYHRGLHCITGLGARGFLTAPLAADILAAMITGAPVPQPRAVLDAVHPARFLIRRLKRGAGAATMGQTREE